MKSLKKTPILASPCNVPTDEPETVLLRERFRRFSYQVSCAVGSPGAFVLSCALLMAWGLSGPIFHFSDTWQLVVNTATTIVTFLMVFLIQNTQNRDAKALHLKLDELIRSVKGARNHLVSLENFSDDELTALEQEFTKIREKSRPRALNGHARPNTAAS